MNRHSSKRKREVEQTVAPSNAFFGYEDVGKSGVLTTSFGATEKFLEVEPSRKRFKAGIQHTLVNGSTTVNRGVVGGISPLLSNEQIHQFINSTVIPHHRTKFNAGLTSSVHNWPQYKPSPKEQNFPTTGLQHLVQIPITNAVRQHNVRQTESQHHIPPVVLPSGQKNRQAIVQVTPHPQSSRVSMKAKHKQLQGEPKNPTAQFTDNSYISYDLLQNHPQTCQSNQLQSWSLFPQAVLTYVKPVEARTRPSKSPKQTFKNVSQEHFEVSRHGCQQGAAKVRPDDTISNGPQRETTISQAKASKTVRSSTKKARGKKNTEQDVVPPKMWTDHVDYPPYVHRIIRILSRAEQRSQTEKEKEKDNLIPRHITQECENTLDDKFSQLIATEDTKCSLPVDILKSCGENNSEQINHNGHNPPITESRVTKILPKENNKLKVDVDELLEELFPESLAPTSLEMDDFYGPEVRVTNEDLCIVESFPCY